METLYISRVIIKNFRNFKSTDVRLGCKQVIIGENNVGKTNFLRAIQLILDPTLSDEDRYLEETDFYNGLARPMENKEIIEISIYISNYSNNETVLSMLSDASVRDNGEKKLLISYKYFPVERENGKIEYQYNIFKGGDEKKKFTYEDRKYLNIKIIKALRDVEGEMRNSRSSPVSKLLKDYSIKKEDLEDIAKKYKESGSDILGLDEIIDLSKNINKKFTGILGNDDFDVSLKTIDVDPNRILYSLKLLLSDRSTSDISLGLSNILYISLMLQLLQDKTIPTYIKSEKYSELIKEEGSDILEIVYEKNEKGNYFLKENLEESKTKDLYSFMKKNNENYNGVTILAIEEPEAHLHPVYQRLVYKDVIRKSNNSVLLTTHSTHITSIAPIKSIVHLRNDKENGTIVNSTETINLNDDELLDVERYLDVKRGEIYTGKGVILVEGVAEEYLVPKFAEILDKPLDEKGIIVCNINSTNFKPYIQLLINLGIPYAVITDGDFYIMDANKDGEETERKYHMIHGTSDTRKFGFLGNEIIKGILNELDIKKETEIPSKFEDQNELFKQVGFFVGYYTLEVDIMNRCQSDIDAKNSICDIFDALTNGGAQQKKNFKNELDKGEFWKCLNKIENNGIGKGRFAQKLSTKISKEHVPEYIEDAINFIYKKVDEII